MKQQFINRCLDPETRLTEVSVEGQVLQIKECISIEKKREILAEALMRSIDNETGIASEINFDKIVTILLTNAYSDIDFTEEEKYELSEQTYNIIISNGIKETLTSHCRDFSNDYSFLLSEFKYMRDYQLSARCVLNEFKATGDELGQKIREYVEENGSSEEVMNQMEAVLNLYSHNNRS